MTTSNFPIDPSKTKNMEWENFEEVARADDDSGASTTRIPDKHSNVLVKERIY